MAEQTKTVLPRKLAKKATSQTEVGKYQKKTIVPNLDGLSNVDAKTVRTLRATSKIVQALRLACRLDGTLSTAVFNLVQVANSGLRLKAYDSTTHSYSPEATLEAKSVLARMDTLYDYSKGYVDRRPVSQVLETALRETILTGAVAGELVLDAFRLPDRVQLVAVETLKFKHAGDGRKYPVQQGFGAEDIELNIPNFWVVESHLGTDSPYPRSMLEASLSTIFYFAEFIEDMRRVVRRSGHNRLVATLSAEQVRATAPAKAQESEELMKTYMESVRDQLQEVISSLEPEDALVVYDVAEVKPLESKGEKADYADLMRTLSGMAATSLKSHPSILGLRLEGSQSLSNTESLIFLQVAKAAQNAVAAFMSRALTLSVRLRGVDAYVKARFRPVDLRPESELAAFRTMEQDRLLDLLSYGLISDDEFCEDMDLPPPGPEQARLSGTFFRDTARSTNQADNASPNSDPMGRALQPDTPSKGGGRSQ